MAEIIVVGDEKSIVLTLASFLKNAGHEVDVAAGARDARAILSSSSFHAAITDITNCVIHMGRTVISQVATRRLRVIPATSINLDYIASEERIGTGTADLDAMLTRLLDGFKSEQITVLLTSLISEGDDSFGANIGISSLMDTILSIRTSVNGRYSKRWLSIAKSRGTVKSDMHDPSHPEKWRFVLYIAGSTTVSETAELTLRRFCERYPPDQYTIDVDDILKAENDVPQNILVVPTVVRSLPPPERRVVGALSRSKSRR